MVPMKKQKEMPEFSMLSPFSILFSEEHEPIGWCCHSRVALPPWSTLSGNTFTLTPKVHLSHGLRIYYPLKLTIKISHHNWLSQAFAVVMKNKTIHSLRAQDVTQN